MKLYKVILKNQSCHNGNFDWSEHLPTSSRPGKWTPRIKDVRECSTGYHVTPYWNMWYQLGCDVYEVEAKGLVKNEQVGVVNKYVCESVRLLKKLDLDFDSHSNTGDRNTGNWNTGNSNTGNWNTGNWNTGDSNTGNWNTGDSNTGNWNTGDWNTGDRNTGNWNTGDRNTGNWNTGNSNTGNSNTGDSNTGNSNTGNSNTGDSNTGDSNTGNSNTGDSNTGDSNTGNSNTGNWNTGDSNTGDFNTGQPQYYELFNKPIDRSMYTRISWPTWFFFERYGTYQESWRKSFETASQSEIEKALALPNFDYKVFEEITGISESDFKSRLAELNAIK